MMKVPCQGLLKAYSRELLKSPLRMHLFLDCFGVATRQNEVTLSVWIPKKKKVTIVYVLCLLARHHHVTSDRIVFRAE